MERLLSGPWPFLAYTADGGNIRNRVYLVNERLEVVTLGDKSPKNKEKKKKKADKKVIAPISSSISLANKPK